ncbi:unnamed protein product [Effrenium voratum]|nr:unnamed protein product [Effrenium voratum]
MGPTAGGTNLSLTITTWPLLLADFHFDCAVGVQRVPARLLQVQSAPDYRSYTLGCTVPAAMNVPRITTAGCSCKKEWFTPQGQMCDNYCCNPGNASRLWCEVEQPLCQRADWGLCEEEDPILAGSYPACVRVVPSNASRVDEYEPCQHRFTYVRQPHVDGISPRSGPSTGGTNVTLTGRYFPEERLGALLCRFGDGDESSVSPGRWLSRTEIACVTPRSVGSNFGLRRRYRSPSPSTAATIGRPARLSSASSWSCEAPSTHPSGHGGAERCWTSQ